MSLAIQVGSHYFLGTHNPQFLGAVVTGCGLKPSGSLPLPRESAPDLGLKRALNNSVFFSMLRAVQVLVFTIYKYDQRIIFLTFLPALLAKQK